MRLSSLTMWIGVIGVMYHGLAMRMSFRYPRTPLARIPQLTNSTNG